MVTKLALLSKHGPLNARVQLVGQELTFAKAAELYPHLSDETKVVVRMICFSRTDEVLSTLGNCFEIFIKSEVDRSPKSGWLLLPKKLLVNLEALNGPASAAAAALSGDFHGEYKDIVSKKLTSATARDKLKNVSIIARGVPSEIELEALIPHNIDMEELSRYRERLCLEISFTGNADVGELSEVLNSYLLRLASHNQMEFCPASLALGENGSDWTDSLERLEETPTVLLPLKVSSKNTVLQELYLIALRESGTQSHSHESAFLAYYKVLEHAGASAASCALTKYVSEQGVENIKALKDKVSSLLSDSGAISALLDTLNLPIEITQHPVLGGGSIAKVISDTRNKYSHAKSNYRAPSGNIDFAGRPYEILRFMRTLSERVLEWYSRLPTERQE